MGRAGAGRTDDLPVLRGLPPQELLMAVEKAPQGGLVVLGKGVLALGELVAQDADHRLICGHLLLYGREPLETRALRT